MRIVMRDLGRSRPLSPELSDALIKGLIQAQLRLALRLSLVVAVGLGGLPLLFHFARQIHPAVPWVLLGVLAYPFLFLVGYAYVRFAEQNERDFAALVKRDT
nr:hypothetical protein [Allorhizocola rhizosphaerae]